jgi:N-acetylmuramoyl-L-alanine amidase
VPPVAGYDGNSGYEPGIDTTPLAGRRILVDPGHGGEWPGALGVKETKEADVNLQVALELAKLLRQAAAEVWLTRETDTDLTSDLDSTLALELRKRARMADSLGAEVFLSVHHNADGGGRNDVNETRTYYRRGDEGPSLDLAQALHRRMVQALRIEEQQLLPGNYSVLRNTRATAAILGEPAYLTYPPTEEKLLQPEAIRLEAEAYFMGLLDYFRRGVPEVIALEWDRRWYGSPAFRPLVVRVDQEPDGIDLMVGSELRSSAQLWQRYLPDQDSWEIRFAPAEPWRDGVQAIAVQVRNANGNHSRLRRDTLLVELEPVQLVLAVQPESLAVGVAGLTLRALDAWGRPLADTLFADEVRWEVEPEGGEAGAGSVLPSLAFVDERTSQNPGELRNYLNRTPESGDLRVGARWRGLAAFGEILSPAGEDSWVSGFVVRTDNQAGIPGAVVSDESSGAITVANYLQALAPGYHSPGPNKGANPALTPIAAGALLGRRIALDPVGGGEESNGVGPGGLRGAAVNLTVARLVQGFLEQAGAQVGVTRSSDAELTGFIRVQRAEDFGAERVVQIARSGSEVSWIGHFPGSVRGQALAERLRLQLEAAEKEIGRAFQGEERPETQIREYADYVLQQTSSPAISVRVADIANESGEDRFLDPAWLHREAYLVYLALAQDLYATELPEGEAEFADSLVSLEVRILDGDQPLSGAGVQLDGMLLVTGLEGTVRFDGLDAGVYHLLTVSHSGESGAREAWIHPQRGRLWQWQIQVEKPEAVEPES